jgi:hypothetical protein
MKRFNPYDIPGTDQIWTDLDLAKWAGLAFVAGLLIGWLM